MHPSKFFNEAACRTGADVFEMFDEDLQQKLKSIHPKNFIKSKITLLVYRVLVRYETDKGNEKELEKYMIIDAPVEDGEYYNELWADMYGSDYCKEHNLKSFHVENIEHICDAVLPSNYWARCKKIRTDNQSVNKNYDVFLPSIVLNFALSISLKVQSTATLAAFSAILVTKASYPPCSEM